MKQEYDFSKMRRRTPVRSLPGDTVFVTLDAEVATLLFADGDLRSRLHALTSRKAVRPRARGMMSVALSPAEYAPLRGLIRRLNGSVTRASEDLRKAG